MDEGEPGKLNTPIILFALHIIPKAGRRGEGFIRRVSGWRPVRICLLILLGKIYICGFLWHKLKLLPVFFCLVNPATEPLNKGQKSFVSAASLTYEFLGNFFIIRAVIPYRCYF